MRLNYKLVKIRAFVFLIINNIIDFFSRFKKTKSCKRKIKMAEEEQEQEYQLSEGQVNGKIL
jgi:type III secretory pathway component EscU